MLLFMTAAIAASLAHSALSIHRVLLQGYPTYGVAVMRAQHLASALHVVCERFLRPTVDDDEEKDDEEKETDDDEMEEEEEENEKEENDEDQAEEEEEKEEERRDAGGSWWWTRL